MAVKPRPRPWECCALSGSDRHGPLCAHFATLAWATVVTYREAPPLPEAIVDPTGQALMTADDIVGGKGGLQKADLMDYGGIYGMGARGGQRHHWRC